MHFIYLFVYLFIYLLIYLFIDLSIYLLFIYFQPLHHGIFIFCNLFHLEQPHNLGVSIY